MKDFVDEESSSAPTGADIVAQALKVEGVSTLFAYPRNPIIEAAAKLGIRPVIVRQERSGVHMADALSRLSSGSEIGVFAMQHGPGAENSFGGVAQAFAESVPILVLPAGYPTSQAGRPPYFDSTVNYRHVTKWAERVISPSGIPGAMTRAFTELRTGAPGPVLVEFPVDVLNQATEANPRFHVVGAARTGPDPTAIQNAAKLLLEADLPLIFAGQGVHYAKAWSELLELAERLEVPVATSLPGKSAFPETHRLSLGAAGRVVPPALRHYAEEADLVLGIGCSFTETVFGISWPVTDRKVIHSSANPSVFNKGLQADYLVPGDAALVLSGILEVLGEEMSPKVVQRRRVVGDDIAARRAQWFESWSAKLNSNAQPITPFRVIKELKDAVPIDRTIITHDAGSPRDQMSGFWQSTTPLTYIGWGKSTQLGYGLPLAMGAKLAKPEFLCINVMGDAAFGFTGMEIETAVRNRIATLTIVLNNSAMACELLTLPTAREVFQATDVGGSYAEMAMSMGAWSERVDEPSDLAGAIERAMAATEDGRTALLEVITSTEIDNPVFDRPQNLKA